MTSNWDNLQTCKMTWSANLYLKRRVQLLLSSCTQKSTKSVDLLQKVCFFTIKVTPSCSFTRKSSHKREASSPPQYIPSQPLKITVELAYLYLEYGGMKFLIFSFKNFSFFNNYFWNIFRIKLILNIFTFH